MDLQIRVFKNSLDEKPVFRSTIVDVPQDMEYSILVKAFKLVFGVRCSVHFNVV